MAPVDWPAILAITEDDVNDDSIDEQYDLISEIDLKADDSGATKQNLMHLFTITRAVLNIKHETAETYLEELTNKAALEGQMSAKEEQKLKDENESLKHELERVKSFGSSDVSKDARKLREKLLDMEEKLKRQDEELQDEVSQHEATKRKLERAEKDFLETDKTGKELKKENDRMREDMREFQKQLEDQKDKMLDKSGDELERRDQLRQKNQEMIEQLDEIKNLSLANKKLQDEVEELSRGLEISIAEMEQMTAAHNKIKGILAASDVTVDQLTRMNEVLQERIDELESELSGKREGDEEIMAAVSNKIQQWKDIVAKKDEMIEERDREIAEMRNQLGLSGIDADRNSHASLQMALKAKDQDMQRLLEQVNEASVELEEYRQLFEEMKQDAGPNSKYLERINELKGKVHVCEQDLKEAVEKQRAAERDSANKDKDLNDAEEKLAQYEAGEYGLAEAVVEIKQLKQQVRIRDSNVEQLIGQINGLELKLNSLWDENEALRVKCGHEPGEALDLDIYRGQMEKKKQEDRAMNIILLNEVEKLENERMNLKRQIRSLAMDKGQRAAALGLTADDIIKIDEFTENLKATSGTARTESFFHVPSSPRKRGGGTEVLYSSTRRDEIDLPSTRRLAERDFADYDRRVDSLEVDRNNLKTRCEHLQQDNQHLCDVIRELKNIKLGETPDKIESIDNLLEVLEARNSDGAYDANLMSKAKIDQLTGRNEELRAQLREVRLTNNKLSAQNDRYKSKLDRMEEELKELKDEGGVGGVVQVTRMVLPEGVTPSSSDVINSLNEHLIVSLKELSSKEAKLVVLEEQLQKYKSHFSMSRHQIGVLYKDFKEKREAWESERKKLVEEKQNLEGLRESDRIRIEEFKRLQDSLALSPDVLKQQLAEVSRRITVLRVNERGLIRRYTIQRDRENELQAEVRRLTNEINKMEANVMKRIGYLERFKTMSVYRIEAVQKALSETVAQSDYDNLQNDLNKITLKYRDLLEKENHLVAKSAAIELLQAEKNKLVETLEKTKKEWASDKEKLNHVEQLLAKSSSLGGPQNDMLDTNEVAASKKIAMLEMKNINETQKAEHASRMYEYQKKILTDLEDRNSQLEEKFSQLTKLSLDAQTLEAELRDELTRCVSKDTHDVTEKRVSELEGVEAKLRVDVSKLKEMLEIANLQVRSIAQQREATERELDDMRELVIDLQKDSDHNKAIGKLHHDKVNLQNKEGMLLMQLQQSRERLTKLEAQSLRCEQKMDEKDNILYHVKLESRSRSMHLKKMIQDLRTKYAGCLPLEKQEKFSDALYGLHEERGRLQKEVHEAEKKRISAEDQLLKLNEQHRGLEELISTLKDNKGAAKVAEWHAKITDIRLQELKGKREMERLREKVRYLERLLAQHENTVAALEEQQVMAAKDQEQQQIYWEQREMELERMVEVHEKRNIELSKWSEEQIDHSPDPNLPVAEQLEYSVRKIKELVTSLNEMKNEVALAKKETLMHEVKIQEKETAVLSRDKIINELRLRMPASSNRDDILRDVLKSDPHLQHSAKVAQQLNDNLKSQLQQKSVEVDEYKELLSVARKDLAEATEQHRVEVTNLQTRLAAKTEESFIKFKQYAQGEMQGGRGRSMSDRELRRLAELEDVVAEQANIMASLNHTIQNYKREKEDTLREHQADKDRMEKEKQLLIADQEKHSQHLMKNIDEQSEEISSLRKEMDTVKMELELQKSENVKAPTTAMRSMVDRLKKQLEDKDVKMKALSKALTDLRADMVKNAAESVKDRARSTEDSLNVQQIVEKQTKQLQDELLDSRGKLEKLKMVVKKCKEEEVHSQTQIAYLQDELKKRDFELKNRPEKDLTGTAPSGSSSSSPSKNLFHASNEPGVKTARAVSEEAKKWQVKVDAVKDKLRLKTAECERLERSNLLLKENLARADKERVSRVLYKEASSVSSATQKQMLDSLEATRKQNLELHDEVAFLKRQALIGKDGAFEELQLRNRLLQEKVDELQEELSLRTPRKEGNAGLQDAYARLIAREESLQQSNLKLAQENIELRFQAEQAKLEMPKLMTKIEELQRQVEVLNSELYDKPVRERKIVGSTGKTVAELEKTIGLMKKCMEKVQTENDRLKKVPAVIASSKMEELQQENTSLKEEVLKCRKAVETDLSGRYESLQLGTAKVAAENERLLIEIQKERDTSEEAAVKVQKLNQDNSQLKQEVDKLQQIIQKLRRREVLDSSLHSTTSASAPR